MIISCIVATGNNREIGVGADLPWRLSSDLKYFKKTTSDHHILMGRKTFESIGKPLPNRTNIVLTRDTEWYRSDVIVSNNILDAISKAKLRNEKELFIIGGAMIYEQTKKLWDKLYLAQVDADIPEADMFFPELNFDEWNLLSEQHNKADEKNIYDFCFKVFER